MDMADVIDAATRFLGEHNLARYLDIECEQLRRYGDGTEPVPQLVAFRVLDLLLTETADPSLTLEALEDVLHKVGCA